MQTTIVSEVVFFIIKIQNLLESIFISRKWERDKQNDLLTVNHSIWDADSFSEFKVVNAFNRSNSRKSKQRTPVEFN